MKKEKLIEAISELSSYDDEVVAAYLELGITASTDPLDIANEIDEAYSGSFLSDEDFARSIAEETGDMPKNMSWPLYCIDWELAARDLMMDYAEEDGHYFRNI